MPEAEDDNMHIEIVDSRDSAFVIIGEVSGKVRVATSIPPLDVMLALAMVVQQIGQDNHISPEVYRQAYQAMQGE